MAITSIASVKSNFETGDRPTQTNFVDFIDTVGRDTPLAIASAAEGGKVGLFEILGVTDVTARALGTFGADFISAETEASAQSIFNVSVLSEAVSLTGIISPTQITSDQNDYAPTGLSTSSTLRLDSDASRAITGLGGGSSGRVVIMENVGSNAITLTNESASSSAANRFSLTSGVTLSANDVVTLKYDATASRWRALARPQGTFPPNFLDGLALTIGTDADHDIDIAVGSARDDGDSTDIRLETAITKQIDAPWAVGTNAGGLDTGTVTTSTVYYLWLIQRPDTGVEDVLFSLSSTSPTMPTNYTIKRRIGSIATDASSNLSGQITRVLSGGREFFQSAQLTITSAGTLTLTHGMSNTPTQISVSLYCASAEGGFTTGQETPIISQPLGSGAAAISAGASMVPTSTTVTVRYGSNSAAFERMLNNTTGASFNPTNTNWRLIVRAWAD